MPTATHEALIHLFQHRPALAAELLAEAFDVPVPRHEKAKLNAADLADLVPTEYRADAVIVFTDGADSPQLAVVIEAQLREKSSKRWAWPCYLTNLRARLRCPSVLLVVCPYRAASLWCAAPIELGHPGFTLTPLVLGPDRIPVVTDAGKAAANPQLAGLSVIAHGTHPRREEIFHAFLDALRFVDPDQGPLYYEVVLAALPESAQLILEKIMTAGTFEFKSQFARTYIAKGKAEGEAKAILGFLDARDIHVTDEAKARITGCTDPDQLNTWVRRAATATTIDDLFG